MRPNDKMKTFTLSSATIRIKFGWLICGLAFLAFSYLSPVVAAQTNTYKQLQYPFYDSETAASSACGISSSASLDRFLQSLAALESADPSNGNPTATNPYSDASGRYQYLDSTWRGRVGADGPYPPGTQYARALNAPSEVQDAVAYIEYAAKAIQYQGDVAKMTLSHIYPDAVDKPNEWATYRVGHNPTAQEYIDNVVNKINSGVGSTIILGYQSAPDFQKYLDKATGGQSIPDLLINGSSVGGSPITSCVCTPSGTQTISGNGNVVVIDPGHGPNSVDTDSATGLKQSESNNVPEVTEVWDVSQTVKADLEKVGYSVTLTKQNVNDKVTFRERANIANNAGAAIAVSIHNDHGQPYSFKEVYPQEVGAYRIATSSGEKISFSDSAVAQKSREYSNIFKQEREQSEDGSVTVKLNSFDGRAGIEPGNIPMVQLFAEVPWLYNEVGAQGNMTSKQKADYAHGITNSIKKAVPVSGSFNNQAATVSTNCNPTSNLTRLIQEYAWPEYRDPDIDLAKALEMKPAYAIAVKKAQAEKIYVGGENIPGIDCGGFVSLLMRNSGADPNYNSSVTFNEILGSTTTWQEDYMKKHPEKYQSLGTKNSTTGLAFGDIAINSEHTYMYIGENGIPGFERDSVSSSLNSRAPMASTAYFSNSAGSFNWYRLIR